MKMIGPLLKFAFAFMLLGILLKGCDNLLHGVGWLFDESTIATAEERTYNQSNSAVQLPARIGGTSVKYPVVTSHQHYTYNVNGQEYRGVLIDADEVKSQFEIYYSEADPEKSGLAGPAIKKGLLMIAFVPVCYLGIGLILYAPVYILAKIRRVEAVSFKNFWL